MKGDKVETNAEKARPANRDLTHDRLRELLAYNPKTGKFYNRVARGSGAKVGAEAGCTQPNGYVQIGIGGNLYAHRLAWLYVHGYMPEHGVDHIDRNPGNNRIDNLREASQICNSRNCGSRSHNTSGVKGVSWYKPRCKWNAYITVNRRRFNLGYYDDFNDAVCVRLAAEQCLGWEGCDSSSPAYRYVCEHITTSK